MCETTGVPERGASAVPVTPALSTCALHPMRCRAPKPAMPDVGSFEDLLAQARQQGGAAPAAQDEQQDCGDAALADGSTGDSGQKGAVATAVAGPAGQQGGSGGGEEDGEDLLIMDSDEEGGEDVRLVDLPSSTRKKQQERMPWITQVGV